MTRSIEWRDGVIVIIDQRALPHVERYDELRDAADVAAAISSLAVRGAPALGIVGAYGVAQASGVAQAAGASGRVRAINRASDPVGVLARAQEAGVMLAATRPTAVNLAWGIGRVLARGRDAVARGADGGAAAAAMLAEAHAIAAEDERACAAMGANAREFFGPGTTVLTHCNTGFLCTGGIGTALGAIRTAHEAGLVRRVIATETRPLLQGARLTVWELGRLGIPHALVVDSAAAGLIARGEIDLVITGADRIAANGDVVNKVGTYPLALAARAAGVPFVVVAPTSTIDFSTYSGADIEVEQRAPEEVTCFDGRPIAPAGTEVINPAFDLTPAALVTAIVTERGVARPPFDSMPRAEP